MSSIFTRANNLVMPKENKTVFVLGDFNIDLLKYEKHSSTNEFLDLLSSHIFLPYILHPTRIHGLSRTLINDIFSNQYNKQAISDNLKLTISDHLPQFLFVPSIFSDLTSSKSNIYNKEWSKFSKEYFVLDYFEKDWDSILNLTRNDIDSWLNNFLMNMNELLDK